MSQPRDPPPAITHIDALEEPRSAGQPASNIRWLIFALACGTSFLLYLHRYSWNLIGPSIQSEHSLSNTQLALLFSLFYYSYSSCQIPSGIIIDRFGTHRFLTALIVIWSFAVTAIAHSTHFFFLGFWRLIFGAAQAGCYPALSKVTQQWFPPNHRTALQGWIATTCGRSGGAMSPILLGTILMGWYGLNWKVALTILGSIGLLFAIAFWRVFRNSPRDHNGVNQAEIDLIAGAPRSSEVHCISPPHTVPKGLAVQNRSRRSLAPSAALQSRSMRFFVLQQFLDAGSDIAFVSLIGAYFLEARGLEISATGWLASLPLWGGAVGGIVGGWLNDRGIRAIGSRWARSLVGFFGKLMGCGLLLLVANQDSAVSAGLCLMAAKFFSDWSQPTTWGTCTDLGGRFSATVFGIINTAGTISGVVMPLVFGRLLDWFTSESIRDGQTIESTEWGPLFILLSAMYLASGICWLLVDCTKPIDQQEDAPAL